jgi:hypothetical protein
MKILISGDSNVGGAGLMRQDVIVQELVQDVHELIRLKSYGLYELVWTLNIDHPELSADQKIDMSLEAVKQLVMEDRLRIVKLIWPSEDVIAEIELSQVTRSDFDDPANGVPYAALMEDSATDTGT